MDDLMERLLPEMRRGVMQIAILTLLREKCYGYSLCKSLAERGFPIEEGTLYPILRRMEDQEIIHSTWNTEGPRPRKYYLITRAGNELLKKLELEWEEISKSLEKILRNGQRS